MSSTPRRILPAVVCLLRLPTLCVGALAMALLPIAAHATIKAEKIRIDQTSKVLVLSGYWIDVTRQGNTPIHANADEVLSLLSSDLQKNLDIPFHYMNERTLNNLIDRDSNLKRGDLLSIRTVFKTEGFTHLMVANISEDKDRGHGNIRIEIAPLKDGIAGQSDSTRRPRGDWKRHFRVGRRAAAAVNLVRC
jgi:hypothetical protein